MLDVRTIDREGLERKMAMEPPDNDSKSSGYALPRAAAVLRESGFEKVYDYAEGLTDWREAGNRLTMLEH
jgi:hypothetical protein